MSLKRADRKLGVNRTKLTSSPAKMHKHISHSDHKEYSNYKNHQLRVNNVKKAVKNRILDTCESDESDHVSEQISNCRLKVNGTRIYDSDNESYCSAGNTSNSQNSYIDDEAFEKSGDESFISTDSNEIVDHGESVGSSSDIYISSDDTYERGSFLCSDDSGNAPLLSDSENELMKDVKSKRKAITLRDSSSEPEDDFSKRTQKIKETKSHDTNDVNNSNSRSIQIISDETLHLLSSEDDSEKIAKISANKPRKKLRRQRISSESQSESKSNSESSNVASSDLELQDPKKYSLEIKIHLPKTVSQHSQLKRKRSQTQNLDSIETQHKKNSPVIINSVISSTTSSTISDLRKKIKRKCRVGNFRHMSKFRIKELPKNQPQQQFLDKLFLIKNRQKHFR